MREKEHLIRVENETGRTLYIANLFGGYHIMVQQLANGSTTENTYELYGPYKAIGYASRRLKALAVNSDYNYTKFYYKSKTLLDKYGAFINKTLPNITEK